MPEDELRDRPAETTTQHGKLCWDGEVGVMNIRSAGPTRVSRVLEQLQAAGDGRNWTYSNIIVRCCELPGYFYGGDDSDMFLACGFDETNNGRELGSRLYFITGKIMVRV